MSEIIDCKRASEILKIDRNILNKIIKKRGGIDPYKIKIPLETQIGNRCFFIQDKIENCAEKLKEKRLKSLEGNNSRAFKVNDKEIFQLLKLINTIKEKENRDPSIKELVTLGEGADPRTIMQIIRAAVLKGYLQVDKQIKNGKRRNIYTILKMPPVVAAATPEYAETEFLVNRSKLQKMEDRHKDLIKEVQDLLEEMDEKRRKILDRAVSLCYCLRDLKNDLPQI